MIDLIRRKREWKLQTEKERNTGKRDKRTYRKKKLMDRDRQREREREAVKKDKNK